MTMSKREHTEAAEEDVLRPVVLIRKHLDPMTPRVLGNEEVGITVVLSTEQWEALNHPDVCPVCRHPVHDPGHPWSPLRPSRPAAGTFGT
jgi:hypothetical protein